MSPHEYADLNPPDAIVAVRSLPRRFAAVLTPIDPDDAETMLRPADDGVSAAGHGTLAARALDQAARALRGEALAPDSAAGGPDGAEAALADLGAAADRLAATAERLAPADWKESTPGGDRADAVLRRAVAAAIDHLKRAEAARSSTR